MGGSTDRRSALPRARERAGLCQICRRVSAGARGYIDRVLRTRLCRYSIVVAAVLAFGGSSADAEPAEAPQAVRAERPIAIALSPVFPWISGHDATVPLPALRLGLNVSPRLALACACGLTAWVEAGAGLFSYEAAGPRSTELGGYLGVGIGYRLED